MVDMYYVMVNTRQHELDLSRFIIPLMVASNMRSTLKLFLDFSLYDNGCDIIVFRNGEGVRIENMGNLWEIRFFRGYSSNLLFSCFIEHTETFIKIFPKIDSNIKHKYSVSPNSDNDIIIRLISAIVEYGYDMDRNLFGIIKTSIFSKTVNVTTLIKKLEAKDSPEI